MGIREGLFDQAERYGDELAAALPEVDQVASLAQVGEEPYAELEVLVDVEDARDAAVGYGAIGEQSSVQDGEGPS